MTGGKNEEIGRREFGREFGFWNGKLSEQEAKIAKQTQAAEETYHRLPKSDLESP